MDPINDDSNHQVGSPAHVMPTMHPKQYNDLGTEAEKISELY